MNKIFDFQQVVDLPILEQAVYTAIILSAVITLLANKQSMYSTSGRKGKISETIFGFIKFETLVYFLDCDMFGVVAVKNQP